MYEYISGKLVEKTPARVVIDVGGIGYSLGIPVSTFSALPEIQSNVKLLTHFVVREDAQLLFGFFTQGERDLFLLLISISGIGPKVANTVLSGMGAEDFKRAILQGSIDTLTSISGIGKKTAERMVVELKEKVDVADGELSISKNLLGDIPSDITEDALQALIALGYTKSKSKGAIEKVFKSESDVDNIEGIIREALKYV